MGAKLRLVTARGAQHSHVNTAVGYGSSSDRRVHFGLGGETCVRELTITWPSGKTQTLEERGRRPDPDRPRARVGGQLTDEGRRRTNRSTTLEADMTSWIGLFTGKLFIFCRTAEEICDLDKILLTAREILAHSGLDFFK